MNGGLEVSELDCRLRAVKLSSLPVLLAVCGLVITVAGYRLEKIWKKASKCDDVCNENYDESDCLGM